MSVFIETHFELEKFCAGASLLQMLHIISYCFNLRKEEFFYHYHLRCDQHQEMLLLQCLLSCLAASVIDIILVSVCAEATNTNFGHGPFTVAHIGIVLDDHIIYSSAYRVFMTL